MWTRGVTSPGREIPSSEISGSYSTHLDLVRDYQTFPKVAAAFLPATHEGSHFSTSSPTFIMVFSTKKSGCEKLSHWVWGCISLVTKDTEHLFTCSLAVGISSLVKYPFKSFWATYLTYSSFTLVLNYT